MTHRSYFARAGVLTGFHELVHEYGVDPIPLLNEVGLNLGALQDPDRYLSYLTIAKLLTLAAERCQAEDFGVRLGERQGLETTGALASCLCLQPTLGDALRILQKNLAFHARGVRLEVRFTPDAIDINMLIDFIDHTDCTQLIGVGMVVVARCIAQLNASAPPPTNVALIIPKPRMNVAGFYRAFNCDVQFSAQENRIRYGVVRDILGSALQVEPEVRERISHLWRAARISNTQGTLKQQVEKALMALLPTGECNLAMVAAMVDMHPRTLQRRLIAKQTCYGDLLKQIRLLLACQNLENADIDLTLLAMNLGFEDIAVFSRAFKKWTGLSPRNWRKQKQCRLVGD